MGDHIHPETQDLLLAFIYSVKHRHHSLSSWLPSVASLPRSPKMHLKRQGPWAHNPHMLMTTPEEQLLLQAADLTLLLLKLNMSTWNWLKNLPRMKLFPMLHITTGPAST